MNAHSETPLNIQDVPRLFSKYWLSMLITTIVTTALSVVIATHMPRKFKTHFVLTIYSKYFQSPLVGDFIPELSESSEGRAQRESLIRQVLTPEYLDSIGMKYNIYDSTMTSAAPSLAMRLREIEKSLGLVQPRSRDSELSEEREELRSRIGIDALNTTTFMISFMYSDPAVTLQVTQDIYDHVIQNLLAVRMHTLGNVRDAIQNRVLSLSATIAASASGNATPTVPAATQSIVEELANVRAQIRIMTSQYTEEHPVMIQMRNREKALASQLDNSLGSSTRSNRSAVEGANGESGRDIYGDLTKKLNYLNIAIDSDRQHESDYFATLEPPLYPSSPLGPRKSLMTLWGVAFGIFASLFISAIREYFHRSMLHAADLAHQLNVPLLGTLPSFPPKSGH